LLKNSILQKKINFAVFLVGSYLITIEFDGLRSAWNGQDYLPESKEAFIEFPLKELIS